jgi:hypothetical protein
MKKVVAGLALGLASAGAMAKTPSMEEMWAIIQQQQAEIESLRGQLAVSGEELQETNLRLEATADIVEEQVLAGGAGDSWTDKTSIGGYAEMHYNNLDNNKDGGDDKEEMDFHRFVFFLGHEFSDSTRFFSEVEIEHSLVEGGEDSGEVELEQAYIEHDLAAAHRLKAGLFLVPVGILNETHEPDTFYGVERNNVEKNIIPTTWWEGGLGLNGEIAPGFSYDATMTSGLGLEEGDWAIRSGRQKVSKAKASDFAYTGRLKYTGIAGLELAGSLQYQEDIYQGELDDSVDAMLYEAHAAYQAGPFGLRALVALWDIDDGINAVQEGADRQEGWYIEPTWRINRDFGLFARYSEWDNQAGSGSGDTEYDQWDVGVNYWLEENVVFKFDYLSQSSPDGKNEFEGFNLGVGWSY